MSKIRTTHYYIEGTDVSNRPDSPFCVIQISDLHNALFGEGQEELLSLIAKEAPALILCTGDLVTARHKKRGMKNALRLLRGLTRKYPVYAVDGNHETRMEKYPQTYGGLYTRYIQRLWEMDVHLLNNRTLCTQVNGMKLALTGYAADLSTYRRVGRHVPDAAQIRETLGEPQEGAFRILLAHHPDFARAYGQWGAELVLSGHVHGGIVRLPLLGGVFGADWKPFPRYDRGRFRLPGKTGSMIVSAGLGEHTAPMRINNPPELVCIHFS